MEALGETPPPPTRVRLLRGGVEIPVELLFDGIRADGRAAWSVVAYPHLPGDELLVEGWPERCVIAQHSPGFIS